MNRAAASSHVVGETAQGYLLESERFILLPPGKLAKVEELTRPRSGRILCAAAVGIAEVADLVCY